MSHGEAPVIAHDLTSGNVLSYPITSHLFSMIMIKYINMPNNLLKVKSVNMCTWTMRRKEPLRCLFFRGFFTELKSFQVSRKELSRFSNHCNNHGYCPQTEGVGGEKN